MCQTKIMSLLPYYDYLQENSNNAYIPSECLPTSYHLMKDKVYIRLKNLNDMPLNNTRFVFYFMKYINIILSYHVLTPIHEKRTYSTAFPFKQCLTLSSQ